MPRWLFKISSKDMKYLKVGGSPAIKYFVSMIHTWGMCSFDF